MNPSASITLSPLSDEQLLQLAPLVLPLYRTTRYQADDICVRLAQFAPNDQQTLRQLYATMGDLLSVVETATNNQQDAMPIIQEFMRRTHWHTFILSVKRLGISSDTWQASEQVSKVLHDLKGGCFAEIWVTLQLMERGQMVEDDLLRLFFITRDYLKIMRTGVCDLDAAHYAEDCLLRAHSVQLLVDKWHQAQYRMHDSTARVMLDCRFSGTIAERCLEFAAVDRMMYNLINNAAKNTTDGLIYLIILPLPSTEPHDLRIVVYNRIAVEHQRILAERYGDQLSALFYGGFTTGGTGLGMRICADIVANTYGLSSVQPCVEQGYVGARCIGEYFVNWFHYPTTNTQYPRTFLHEAGEDLVAKHAPALGQMHT